MAALITLCNQAVASIGAGQMADLDEATIESRECNRFAQSLLDEIGEWADWPFKRKRVQLASVANDRPAEWLYAYAEPTDMARPLQIRQVEDTPTNLPIWGPTVFPVQDAIMIPFLHEQQRIYTNVQYATLVYIRSDITANDLAPLLQRAFVLELAARICLPVKKDAKLAMALSQEAMTARMMAIADEENKNPRQDIRYVSEAEWARAGYVP